MLKLYSYLTVDIEPNGRRTPNVNKPVAAGISGNALSASGLSGAERAAELLQLAPALWEKSQSARHKDRYCLYIYLVFGPVI